MKLTHQQAGFTLMELLLVIGIITILTVVAAPIYNSFNNTNQLDAASSLLQQDLYQAQTHSRNQLQDSAWGVAVSGQNIVLFSGNTYATRNTANDFTYTVPTGVSLSGSSEVDYSKLYGLPTASGSFTLTTKTKSATVTVNNKGMVDY